MTKLQAQALVRLQAVSGVMSLTVRAGEVGGEWSVRILAGDWERMTANFPHALMLIAEMIDRRTP